MIEIVEVVRTFVNLLVEGKYSTVERLTSGDRLSAAQIESAIATYGDQLVYPPNSVYDDLDVVKVTGSDPLTWNVRFPLWTLNEGRSDLEIRLTLCEVAHRLYSTQLDDILVP